MNQKLLGLLLLLLLLTGCDGQLRIDASSADSMQASTNAISDSLGSREAAEFKAAVRELVARSQSEHPAASETEQQQFLKDKLHGKTAAQTIEAAAISRQKRLEAFGAP